MSSNVLIKNFGKYISDSSKENVIYFNFSIMKYNIVQVSQRISGMGDLVAAEAIYHRNCRTAFTRLRSNHTDDKQQAGRPADSDIENTMQKVWEHLCNISPALYVYISLFLIINS